MNQSALARCGSVFIRDQFQLGKRHFSTTLTNHQSQIYAKEYLHIGVETPSSMSPVRLCHP